MNRRVFNTLVAISLFGMLAAPAVQAQSGMQVANIPFQFNVGKAALPAGEYHVKQMNTSTLMIQSKDGHRAAVALVTVVSSSKEGDKGKLVFNRYGTQYFLSKVWTAGSREGSELVKSRAEIEVAKNSSAPESTKVAIKTP
jgi:hypothetical protein